MGYANMISLARGEYDIYIYSKCYIYIQSVHVDYFELHNAQQKTASTTTFAWQRSFLLHPANYLLRTAQVIFQAELVSKFRKKVPSEIFI